MGYAGQCMENLDIRAMDSRDAYGRDRFLPLPLEYHLTLGILPESSFSWDGHPSFYPVQMVLSSDCFFFYKSCFLIRVLIG